MIGGRVMESGVSAADGTGKAPEIDIVEARAVGRFGRLFVAGSENSVNAAVEAAVSAVEAVDGVPGG